MLLTCPRIHTERRTTLFYFLRNAVKARILAVKFVWIKYNDLTHTGYMPMYGSDFICRILLYSYVHYDWKLAYIQLGSSFFFL